MLSGNRLPALFRWLGARPRLTLSGLVLAALVPFVTKPFHIDDPMTVWAAQHLREHPLDFYGYDVNWFGSREPMWKVTTNPPLVNYYLAAAAALVGWTEAALHLAFLLPAVAAIVGVYQLALRLCARPRLAACATLFTPAFLVCGTTLMCDMLMLALAVWAIVLWVEGMERNVSWYLAGSGLLIALAALTKYFGVFLIPLLAAYGWMKRRQVGWWVSAFLIPIVALAAYEWMTVTLYGTGQLSRAAHWTVTTKPRGVISYAASGFTALAFVGGCLAGAVFFAPLLWRTRALVGFALGCAPVALALFAGDALLPGRPWLNETSRAWLNTQVYLWAVGGLALLALPATDVWRSRDAGAGLLALWVWGTFLFAGFVNWSVNGRSILPMAPAVGILLARRLERVAATNNRDRQTDRLICVGVGVLVAMLVARADFLFASAAKRSAELTHAKYGGGDQTLWFEGHWGFQYYLEKLGARAVSAGESVPEPGDVLAIPLNNTNASPPDPKQSRLLETLLVPGPTWLTTTSYEVGAGFHSSFWGPLPFVVGNVPPERVLVYVLR